MSFGTEELGELFWSAWFPASHPESLVLEGWGGGSGSQHPWATFQLPAPRGWTRGQKTGGSQVGSGAGSGSSWDTGPSLLVVFANVAFEFLYTMTNIWDIS